MNWQDDYAIAYCRHVLGVDPYETVWGYWQDNPDRICAARWCWYVGARP